MSKVQLLLAILAIFSISPALAQSRYLGNFTINPYIYLAAPQLSSILDNPYGNSSNSLQIYDNQGQYRGNLNSNSLDPNSVANPYGRYGSKYSPDSINNPYGAGNRYRQDSPNNPYGTGMRVYSR